MHAPPDTTASNGLDADPDAALLIRRLAVAILGASVVMAAAVFLLGMGVRPAVYLSGVVAIVMLALVRLGHVTTAAYALCWGLLVPSAVAISTFGIRSTGTLLIPLAIMSGGWLLGRIPAVSLAVAGCLLSLWGYLYHANGPGLAAPPVTFADVLGHFAVFLVTALLALAMVETLRTQFKKLFDYAYNDGTTGLANGKFIERAVNADLSAGRSGILLMVQFSGFNLFHALHGHARGDDVLRDVALMIREHLGRNCVVAKLSTPQFAVWRTGSWEVDPAAISASFKSRLESKLSITKLGLSMASGWVAAPEHGTSFDSLLKNVLVALSTINPSSTEQMIGFNAEMQLRMADDQALKVLIREALDKGQFHAVYQAKVRNCTNEIIGFEGLARMREAFGQPTPGPAAFVPVLHAEGWMNEFGMLMIRLIISDIPLLVQKYGKHIKVAANVSPPLFLSPDFVSQLESLLIEMNVNASNVMLEITEEVFATDPGKIVEVNHQLRRLGVSISLDDFGSGYSSLGYLRSVQFDEIKIDRSFVKQIETDERLFMLLETLCKLSHDLQSRVVLEGVETAEQVQRLTTLEIDYIQGFYFARPERLEALLLS